MQLCIIEVQINFPYITFSNSSLFLIKHPIHIDIYIRNNDMKIARIKFKMGLAMIISIS